MTGDEVRDIVGMLARSQGSYGRLYNAAHATPGAWDDIAAAATDAGVTDAVGFVMWVES